MSNIPSYEEIKFQDPAFVFSLFSRQPWPIFLDSGNAATPMEDTNRYSYIGFDPFEKIIVTTHSFVEGSYFASF